MLRERELAAAVDELRCVEGTLTKIECRLERVRQRASRLTDLVGPPPVGTVTTAGSLAASSLRQEIDRKRISRLEDQLEELSARRDEARSAVEAAREVIASATRALRALDR